MKNNSKINAVMATKIDFFRNLHDNIVNNVERNIILSRTNRVIQSKFEKNKNNYETKSIS